MLQTHSIQRSLPTFLAIPLIFPAMAPAQEVLEEIIVTADFRERAASELPASRAWGRRAG